MAYGSGAVRFPPRAHLRSVLSVGHSSPTSLRMRRPIRKELPTCQSLAGSLRSFWTRVLFWKIRTAPERPLSYGQRRGGIHAGIFNLDHQVGYGVTDIL